MKNILQILIAISILGTASAQTTSTLSTSATSTTTQSTSTETTDVRDEQYQIIYEPTPLTRCNRDGTTFEHATPKEITRWWTFTIIDRVPNGYVIRFNAFTETKVRWFKKVAIDGAKELNLQFYKDSNGNPIYFLMSEDYFKRYVGLYHKKSQFAIAASTTFIKIRPGRKETRDDGVNVYSEIANDFNIGAMAGWTFSPYRKDEWKFHLLAGLSYSSINLNSYNTNKFSSTETATSAITPSAAFVWEYKKFQVGFFSGIDLVSGEAGKHFIYRNRPWIGLGFGFSIFRPAASTDQQSTTTH